MAHAKLYNPEQYLPSGKEFKGPRRPNKTAQDKERDVTKRPRVLAWQKRLNGAKILTEVLDEA